MHGKTILNMKMIAKLTDENLLGLAALSAYAS
jgi:hypothetical protein